MARQRGILTLEGQIGKFSFYKSKKDGYLAREKSGVDAQRVRTDPRFERTRENAAEFGRAGSAAKVLRKSIVEWAKNMADPTMYCRLVALMMRVIRADTTNTRGKRKFIDGDGALLKGFDFNENGKLHSTFLSPFTPVIDRASGTFSVEIGPFVPKTSINTPPTATHAKLMMVALEIDFESNTFIAAKVETPDIVIGPQTEAAVKLTASVSANSVLPLLIVLGVKFSQQVNDESYALMNGNFNALAIVEVDGAV
jgi:hypothetical protein